MKNTLKRFLAIAGLIGFAATLSFLPPAWVVPFAALIAIVLLTWMGKYYLLYTVIFLIPFVGLTIDLSQFAFLRSLPIIGNWDAPIGDFLALTLTTVFGIYMLHYEREKHIFHHVKDHLPAFAWYAPFLIIAALTIFRAPREMQSLSVQYFVRFVVFSYIAFVAMPYWMIKTKAQLRNVIHVLTWSGICISIFGALSLFVTEPFWGIWRRVSPFSMGSIAPIGTNHNLLSEFVIAVIPLALYVAMHTHEKYKKMYALAALFMIIVVMLTFGRTAWIVLAVQALVAWWFIRPEKITHTLIRAWPAFVLGCGLLMYMVVFSSSDFVRLSTDSRVDLTKFSLVQATQTPWLGHGIGTFMPSLSSSGAFNLQYGGPIEAHGFGQKLLFETGLIGLSLFVMFFGYVFISLARAWRDARPGDYKNLILAAYISLLGTFIFQIFNTSYFNAKLWFLVGLALVILSGKWKFKKIT